MRRILGGWAGLAGVALLTVALISVIGGGGQGTGAVAAGMPLADVGPAEPSPGSGFSVVDASTEYEATTRDTVPCTDAEEATNFRFYSLGREFDGLEPTQVMRICQPPYPGEPVRANYVRYIYGNCDPLAGLPKGTIDGAGCAPPITIETWPACERALTDYESAPGVPLQRAALGQRRGAPAFTFDGGARLEIYTGKSTVVLFSGNAERLKRAVASIRAEDPSAPIGPPSASGADAASGDLPEPAQGAMNGDLRCTSG